MTLTLEPSPDTRPIQKVGETTSVSTPVSDEEIREGITRYEQELQDPTLDKVVQLAKKLTLDALKDSAERRGL
jgi:hypothetical protein